jgi:hypothetical protein
MSRKSSQSRPSEASRQEKDPGGQDHRRSVEKRVRLKRIVTSVAAGVAAVVTVALGIRKRH